ncbi:MAG TPA: HAD-IA family hydrolase [Candidatus Babeliales bacterium]|nr:HAD-IA family hydrolase [Candidatus Babeliales bacterium]
MNTTNFSPKTHIFLWDLHDVILTKSMWSWFIICIRFKRKKELISRLDKKTISIIFQFLLERLPLIRKQTVSEELIKAAQKKNNNALIELVVDVCSSYVPIKKTVTLMQELSSLGYVHHLGSNIGKTVFNDSVKKFPTIFSLFKEYTIPFESINATIVKKPYPEFFYAHIEKNNLEPHQIIFIDDKLANVQAAQSLGIHAIHFKNAKQLRKELAKNNIIKE